MKPVLILITVFLSGCENTLQGYDLKKMEGYCADKGGIHHIGPGVAYWVVRCEDGSLINSTEIK
jgi:hypothetical protein